MSKTKESSTDCAHTCQNCAIMLKPTGRRLPPNWKYFCIAHKKALISHFNKENVYVHGIEQATTCPKFKAIKIQPKNLN